MSTNLSDRIANEASNTVMERGIITAMSFFLDQKFLISVDNQFPANQQPVPNPNVPAPLPANWLDNIVIANQNFSVAQYFIRNRNQTFVLDFMYNSRVRKVRVNVNVSSWK